MKRFILLIISAFFCSCASKKSIHYFQNAEKEINITPFKMMEAQKGDILDISIKALNPESVAIFKSNENPNINGAENRIFNGYLVDEVGEINFPIVGKLNVLNKSITDIENMIFNEIKVYIKDPTVKVRILNYKITVLGEVKAPGTLNIQDERFSLPQALGSVGDLTITGDRKNIMIIRRDNDKTITEIVDLTNPNIISSPFYYLNQNDIVYVRPNATKVSSAGFIGSITSLIGLISFVLGLNLFVLR